MFSIFRPVTSIIASLSGVLGVIIGGGLCYPEMIMVFLAILVFCFGGFALNDYYDMEIDRIAHPERVLPSGKLSPRKAFIAGLTFLLLSPVISFFINYLCFSISLLAVALMLSYEKWFKYTPTGNFLIALLASLTFIFGGGAVGKTEKPLFLSAIVFFFILGREILMDIQDMEGDLKRKRKTLPIAVGRRRAKAIALLFIFIAISISILPYKMMGKYYLPLVMTANSLFIFAILSGYKLRELTRLGMLIALLAFLVGSLN